MTLGFKYISNKLHCNNITTVILIKKYFLHKCNHQFEGVYIPQPYRSLARQNSGLCNRKELLVSCIDCMGWFKTRKLARSMSCHHAQYNPEISNISWRCQINNSNSCKRKLTCTFLKQLIITISITHSGLNYTVNIIRAIIICYLTSKIRNVNIHSRRR